MTVQLKLSRMDWARYGSLNIFMVLFSVLAILGSVVIIALSGPIPVFFLGMSILMLFIYQNICWSIYSSLLRKPYITFDDNGIYIDDGPLERWTFKWDEVTTFSPTAEYLEEQIIDGRISISFKVDSLPRRRVLSRTQHLKFTSTFQIIKRITPLNKEQVEEVNHLISRNVSQRVRGGFFVDS